MSKSKEEIQQATKKQMKQELKEKKLKQKSLEELKIEIKDFLLEYKEASVQEVFVFLTNLNNDQSKVVQAFLECFALNAKKEFLKKMTHIPVMYIKNKKLKNQAFALVFKKSLEQNYMESCDCPFLITALGNMLIKLLKRNLLKLKDFFEQSLKFNIEEEEEQEELVFFCESILSFIQSSHQEYKQEAVYIKSQLSTLLF